MVEANLHTTNNINELDMNSKIPGSITVISSLQSCKILIKVQISNRKLKNSKLAIISPTYKKEENPYISPLLSMNLFLQFRHHLL